MRWASILFISILTGFVLFCAYILSLTPVSSQAIQDLLNSLESKQNPVFKDQDNMGQCCVKNTKIKPPKKVYKAEGICRQTLERLYRSKFPTVHPEWLVNPKTKRKLELDCYNERLNIALEYNGRQHYEWPNFTNQSRAEFDKQVARDAYKKTACKRRGVFLITIPYTVRNKDIPGTIERILKENHQL